MKTSITILGLVAVMFTTNTNATNAFKVQDLNQQEVAVAGADSIQLQNQLVLVNKEVSKKYVDNTEEIITIAPVTVYHKDIQDVIADDKLITENQDDNLNVFSLEKTAQDTVSEGNEITESQVSNEVYALDFEKINRMVKNNKVVTNNVATTVDIKL